MQQQYLSPKNVFSVELTCNWLRIKFLQKIEKEKEKAIHSFSGYLHLSHSY